MFFFVVLLFGFVVQNLNLNFEVDYAWSRRPRTEQSPLKSIEGFQVFWISVVVWGIIILG